MTRREALIARVTPVFRDVFDRPDLVVTEELTANSVEQWDSLAHISLIVALEDALKCEFSTEELASMAKVGNLIDILIAKGVS